MMLGQPENAAEYAAEQARLQASSDARERRNVRIHADVAALITAGASYDDATAKIARTAKLGKGATGYVRGLTADLKVSA